MSTCKFAAKTETDGARAVSVLLLACGQFARTFLLVTGSPAPARAGLPSFWSNETLSSDIDR